MTTHSFVYFSKKRCFPIFLCSSDNAIQTQDADNRRDKIEARCVVKIATTHEAQINT